MVRADFGKTLQIGGPLRDPQLQRPFVCSRSRHQSRLPSRLPGQHEAEQQTGSDLQQQSTPIRPASSRRDAEDQGCVENCQLLLHRLDQCHRRRSRQQVLLACLRIATEQLVGVTLLFQIGETALPKHLRERNPDDGKAPE
ncbi:MAG: hypothetical protein AW07_04544 [Candidatus Accumulibacter sp. SK-11]|nr:MAG: hypothetical protein AW07_04544 [Candidatus Accumulibacter sp. SK-11]